MSRAAGPTSSVPSGAGVRGSSSAIFILFGLGPSWGPALVPVRAHFHLSLAPAGSLFLVSGAAGACGSPAARHPSERTTGAS